MFTAEHYEGSRPFTVQTNYRGFSEGDDDVLLNE